MKISMNLGPALRVFEPEKAIELYAKAGFDAYDFSFFSFIDEDWRTGGTVVLKPNSPLMGEDYIAYAKHLRAYADSLGISCNQTHAPFPIRNPGLAERMPWALEISAILGAKHCVIHPDNNLGAEGNAEFYRTLLPLAKELGVKIATENMWNWTRANGLDQAAPAACSDPASFNAHLDAVNDEFLVACLDIGHAEMRGLNTTAPEMIRALGNRLHALHIHDNDKWHDSHEIPFSMSLDWNEIVKALVDIDYKGYFTLECDQYFKNAGYTADSALEGAKNLASAAKKLAKMFGEQEIIWNGKMKAITFSIDDVGQR